MRPKICLARPPQLPPWDFDLGKSTSLASCDNVIMSYKICDSNLNLVWMTHDTHLITSSSGFCMLIWYLPVWGNIVVPWWNSALPQRNWDKIGCFELNVNSPKSWHLENTWPPHGFRNVLPSLALRGFEHLSYVGKTEHLPQITFSTIILSLENTQNASHNISNSCWIAMC